MNVYFLILLNSLFPNQSVTGREYKRYNLVVESLLNETKRSSDDDYDDDAEYDVLGLQLVYFAI
jgi:hypothetical protein